jgi:hypothetical protein
MGMPGGSGDYKVQGDKSNRCDAIPTASQQWQPVTELARFSLETSDVDRYEGDESDDADVDADKGDEALQADDGLMQNEKDWQHGRVDLWTSGVDGYECDDGDVADMDAEQEASQVTDGTM